MPSHLPRTERVTQNRVVALLTQPVQAGDLGYRHLGDWQQRPHNRAIEADVLRANLAARGYSAAHIAAALHRLEVAAEVRGDELNQANMRTYQLLRYGVDVQVAAGQPHSKVHLIDWDNPARNDFALAEEVTLKHGHERRPDIVLYVNGLALVVIELKRGSVEVADGVRQLCTNQEPAFNAAFFSTVQLLLAGNDAQGLRYGTTGTPEQFFVNWRCATPPGTAPSVGALLDGPLAHLCQPERLLDWVRHFVIFDGGQKKVPRQHQFEGIKAAQQRLAQREGGVIWHTQGSGKSILMVLLAKWLLEHDSEARILVVTDREELDKQIVGVMRNAGVIGQNSPSPRVKSRAELVQLLGAANPRLMCALIHKFEATDLNGPIPTVQGRVYVFVDECHRTQGGDMNKQMKRWLSQAIFVGFTGTPLLRSDEPQLLTRNVFGTYIHTYKFHQAVADKVVLDLKYQARDVTERLTSPQKIDEWFEAHTKNLNNFRKALLRKRWATMEALMSAEGRKREIMADILLDFARKPRLNDNRGTAILVASSIYDACHYFRLFRATTFGEHCGLITSYEPNHNAISKESANGEERYKYDTYTQHVLQKGQTPQQYADEVKRQFIKEPAKMKLLIVVSKLLTGFDAPSCTYIYLDNELHNHNLFQAICRTNRLDGADKDYGYIVDFKKLFGDVQEAISVYSSDELDIDQGGGGDNNVPLKNALQEGKKQLEEARQALHYLCEPVPQPREMEQFLHYFCGDAAKPETLAETEALRVSFYKAVALFTRAYANLAQELTEAGYTEAQAVALKTLGVFYTDIRDAIKKHAGEELDTKPYEADMRNLINTYIQADTATPVGDGLDDLSLVEMIVQTGIHDAIAKKLNAKSKLSNKAVAEGIINNVRQTIARTQLTDARFYAQMSTLLDDLIKQSCEDAAAYEAFLQKAEELIRRLAAGQPLEGVPAVLHGNAEAVTLFNNLGGLPFSHFQCPQDDDDKAALVLQIDKAMRKDAPPGWNGDDTKERVVRSNLHKLLQKDAKTTLALFDIIKNLPGYQ